MRRRFPPDALWPSIDAGRGASCLASSSGTAPAILLSEGREARPTGRPSAQKPRPRPGAARRIRPKAANRGGRIAGLSGSAEAQPAARPFVRKRQPRPASARRVCPKAATARGRRRPAHLSENREARHPTQPFVRKPQKRWPARPFVRKAQKQWPARPEFPAPRTGHPAGGPLGGGGPVRPEPAKSWKTPRWLAVQATGSRTMKRAPTTLPSASRRFSAAIRPRSPSTICLLMERPRPECLPKPSPCGRSE